MSLISQGPPAEVFYSQKATATALATFTTEDNLQKTLPPVIIPRGFFANGPTGEGRSIRVDAAGRLGTTASPTFTWSVRLLTSTTWSAAGIGFSSAALTAGATVTLAPWFLTVHIVMRALSIAAASTIAVLGEVRGAASLATPFGGSIPAANVAFTNATYDDAVDHYLFLSAACAPSNALNLIQLEMLKVWGEN